MGGANRARPISLGIYESRASLKRLLYASRTRRGVEVPLQGQKEGAGERVSSASCQCGKRVEHSRPKERDSGNGLGLSALEFQHWQRPGGVVHEGAQGSGLQRTVRAYTHWASEWGPCGSHPGSTFSNIYFA